METLAYILDKFQVLPNAASPIRLPISRWTDFPQLLKELGFKTGAEIGVYRGQFTVALATCGLRVYGIDAWTPYAGYKDFQGQEVFDAAYAHACRKTASFDIQLIKKWSLEALDDFENESLDFVFIDGNHDFEHVVADTAGWARKVRKGGIVSGHDFFDRDHGLAYGVRYAIPAWCTANRISPWFLVKRDKCPSWFYVK